MDGAFFAGGCVGSLTLIFHKASRTFAASGGHHVVVFFVISPPPVQSPFYPAFILLLPIGEGCV